MADIAEVQASWDSRLYNIRHSQSAPGTREYFDEVEARKYFVEPNIPGFAQFERWGRQASSRDRVGHRHRLRQLRAGRGPADGGRSLAAESDGGPPDIRWADANKLSEHVDAEPCYLIYSFGVIHHAPNPRNVIRGLVKFCGPKTEIRLMLHSRWSWKAPWITLSDGKGVFSPSRHLTRRHAEAQVDVPVAFTYSESEVRDLLAGFDVAHVWKDHLFPYRISDFVNYRYKRAWHFRWMRRGLFRWLEHRLGWHALIVARPRQQHTDGEGRK